MRQLFPALLLGLAVTVANPASAAQPLAVEAGERPLPTLAPLLKKVAPSIVSIRARMNRVSEDEAALNAWFPLLFGIPAPEAAKEDFAAGSGIIVDGQNGFILTNFHVVEGATEIGVALSDGTRLRGSLVGVDRDTDLAVLKVEANGLVALELANSDTLEAGDFVIAVGDRFGLGPSATSGIASALHRTSLGMHRYEDFIQTDAAINVGDSGGALLDLNGRLVGVTTVIIEHEGGSTNIGFAIPANLARPVMAQLIRHGDIRRGQIGIKARDPADDRARGLRRNGLPVGAELMAVGANSTADVAGLRAADIITAVNGAPVRDAADLRNRLALIRQGEAANISLLRENYPLQASVTLEPIVMKTLGGGRMHPALAGVVFRIVESMLDEPPQIEAETVLADSDAWQGGLRPGDIIVSMNGRAVETPERFFEQLRQAQGQVLFGMLRKGRSTLAFIR